MRKPVRHYEGLYEVDELGNVFSLPRIVPSKHPTQKLKSVKGRQLIAAPDSKDYLSVSLSKDGKVTHHRVHRIVLMAFEYQEGCELLDGNHEDGNKNDCSLGNLTWMTRAENIQHSFDVLGRVASTTGKFGKDHHRAKAVKATPVNGGAVLEFGSLMDAERAGFSAGHICSCLKGTRKTHKGFTWSE